jgi:hypothetical protein
MFTNHCTIKYLTELLSRLREMYGHVKRTRALFLNQQAASNDKLTREKKQVSAQFAADKDLLYKIVLIRFHGDQAVTYRMAINFHVSNHNFVAPCNDLRFQLMLCGCLLEKGLHVLRACSACLIYGKDTR